MCTHNLCLEENLKNTMIFHLKIVIFYSYEKSLCIHTCRRAIPMSCHEENICPCHEKTNVLHICENKDADQLHGNRKADQQLCFCSIDSTIPLLSKAEDSSL